MRKVELDKRLISINAMIKQAPGEEIPVRGPRTIK